MTQKQYVRQAAHRLHLPRGMKRAVLDGLVESFESAREHGETEENVIARLGSPRAFAREALQSAELTESQRSCIRRERSLRMAAIVCAACILIMGGALTVRAVAEAVFRQTVIGYTNVPTQILVTGICAAAAARFSGDFGGGLSGADSMLVSREKTAGG